jgi:hypothetical protein
MKYAADYRHWQRPGSLSAVSPLFVEKVCEHTTIFKRPKGKRSKQNGKKNVENLPDKKETLHTFLNPTPLELFLCHLTTSSLRCICDKGEERLKEDSSHTTATPRLPQR